MRCRFLGQLVVLVALIGSAWQVQAQTAAPASEVLLADNFDDPSAGQLTVGSDQPEREDRGYVDGEYFIKKLDPTRAGGPTTWLPGDYADATLSVDARLVGPVTDRFVALICRSQGELSLSDYDLLVDPSGGRFMLARFDGGNLVGLARWTPSAAINGGTGTNHIELTCAGPTLSATINGTQVVRLLDRTFSQGGMGLLVGTSREELTVEARFDNLVVVSATPPPPPPTPAIGWTHQIGTAGWDGAYQVARDSEGNLLMVGATAGALSGQRSAGGDDAFLSKRDSTGNEVWTQQFGAAGDDAGLAVAVDRSDNIFVAGVTESALPGQLATGNLDAFVRKYSPNGSALWTRQFGTAGEDQAVALATDAAGDVFVAGWTLGALTDQGSAGGADAFVRAYDGSGAELWTRQFGAAGDDMASSLAVDGATGTLYVVGTARALPDAEAAGENDAYLRAYDLSGKIRWTRQFGTDKTDHAWAVAVDGAGGVYVGGTTSGSFAGQRRSGAQDAFLCKYDDSGNLVWMRQFGASSTTDVDALTVDPTSNVYVAGDASGALPDQPSIGATDAYVAVYGSDGNQRWTYQFGFGGTTEAGGLATDSMGDVFVSGQATDPFAGQRPAESDAFLMKLIPPAAPSSAAIGN
jgi:Beta-propeller repeat